MSITVVIHSAHLDEDFFNAVASVQAQSYQDLKILLCSLEPSAEVREKIADLIKSDPRIAELVNPINIGRNAVTLQAWRQVKTDYIMFLSDHDSLEPECISTALEAFVAKPSAGLWYPQYQLNNTHHTPIRTSKTGPTTEQGFDFLYAYLTQQQREWYFSGTLWHRRTVQKAQGIQFSGGLFDLFTLIQTALARPVLHSPEPLINHTYDETRPTHGISPSDYIDQVTYLQTNLKALHNKAIEQWLSKTLAHHALAKLSMLKALEYGPVKQSDKKLFRKFLSQFFPQSCQILSGERVKEAGRLLGWVTYPPIKSVYLIDLPEKAKTPRQRNTVRELFIHNILEVLSREAEVEIWGEDFLVATGKYFLDQYNQLLETQDIPPINYILINHPNNQIEITPEDQAFIDRLLVYRFKQGKQYQRLDQKIRQYRLFGLPITSAGTTNTSSSTSSSSTTSRTF